MKYNKPIVSATSNAIQAIQSSTLKWIRIVLDVCQTQKPVALATTCAYEADEYLIDEWQF